EALDRGVEVRVDLGGQLQLDRGDGAAEEAGALGELLVDHLIELGYLGWVVDLAPAIEVAAQGAAGRDVGQLARGARGGPGGGEGAAPERLEAEAARGLIERAVDRLAQGERVGGVEAEALVEARAVVIEEREHQEGARGGAGAARGGDRDEQALPGAGRGAGADRRRRDLRPRRRRLAAVHQRLDRLVVEIDLARRRDPAERAAQHGGDQPVVDERHRQRAGQGRGQGAPEDHAAVRAEVV